MVVAASGLLAVLSAPPLAARPGGEVAPAASGDLDTTWSGDGVLPFSSRYAITLAPHGTAGGMYVGSYKVTDGNGNLRVSRFEANGAPSAGWGSAGFVRVAFQSLGSTSRVSFPVQVIPVGIRVTVVGEYYDQGLARLGVLRLRSDGSYDTSFKGDGSNTYKVFPEEHDVVTAFRAQVLAGGKIGLAVAALDLDAGGDFQLTRQAMVRLNANGSMDTTFSGDGLAIVPNSWSDVRWTNDGGAFVGNQGSISHEVRKLRPSGQLDTSFSLDGIASAACGPHRGANLGVDPSGRPVLQCVKVSGGDLVLAMYRFHTNGAFDPSYSGDGKTSWVIPGAANGDARLTFDAAAKPWAATSGVGGPNTVQVYTLDSSGAPDAAYSGDGTSEVVLPGPADLSGLWHFGSRVYVTTYQSDTVVHINALED